MTIPDDIMKAAREGVAKWLDEPEGFSTRRERVNDSALPWLETAWALAITAEREANAQLLDAVAEQFAADSEAEQNPLKVPAIKSVSFALSSVASAIREGEGE